MEEGPTTLVAPPVLVPQETKERLKGQLTRDAVARLKLYEGLTLRAIARRETEERRVKPRMKLVTQIPSLPTAQSRC
jgi:hypothetical protein